MKTLMIIFILFIVGGCSSTYRPSIIDIRDEPYYLDWGPRQPEKLAHTILEFQSK